MNELRLENPPSTLPSGSTVWAYLRDSGGPTQSFSVQQQRDIIEEYCARHGLVLTHPPFEDVHRSGGSVKNRDEFMYMMSLSTTHEKPQGLLIWNFARFSRGGPYDAQLYKANLRSRGIIIHSLTDKVPEGEFGPVVEVIIDIANKQKKDEAAMGAWRGLRHNVKQGAVSGTPPKGIKRSAIRVMSAEGVERTAHRWDPDPEYSARIVNAFQLRAEGKSLAQIHAETGLLRSVNSYVTFFSNPIYIGTLQFGEMTVENYCAPIVPRELWDKVQAIITTNANRRHLKSATAHPRQAAGTFLLSGIVVCARCGSTHVTHSSPQKYGEPYRTYKCGAVIRRSGCTAKPIPAKVLETLVMDAVMGWFDDPDNLINMLAALQADTANARVAVDEKIASLSSRLGTVRRKLGNTAAAIAEVGTSPTLKQTLKTLETEEAELVGQIAQLRNTSTDPIPVPSVEEARQAGTLVKADLQSRDPVHRRQTLLGILHAVTVDRVDRRVMAHVVMYKKKAYDVSVPISFAPVGAHLHTHSIFVEADILPRGRPKKKPIV